MAFRRAKERKVKIFIGHLPDRVNNCSLRLSGGFPKTIALIGSIPAVAQADPSCSKESPEFRLGAVQRDRLPSFVSARSKQPSELLDTLSEKGYGIHALHPSE